MVNIIKKIIAREFLFLVISTLIIAIIMLISYLIKENKKGTISILTKDINILEGKIEKNICSVRTKKLYNLIYKNGDYTKSFEEYEIQFSKYDSQVKLFNGLKKAEDYSKKKFDFIKENFICSEEHYQNLDDVVILLQKKIKIKESYIYRVSYEDLFKNLALIILLVIFGFRYLFYLTKWSINEIKK